MRIKNPFEIIDKGLLRFGAIQSQFLYRSCGLHPVLHRHLYRFVVSALISMTLVLMEKKTASDNLFLLIIPLMFLFNWRVLRKDMPRILQPWDQTQWKWYSALAGMMQASIGNRVACMAIMVVTSTSIVQIITKTGEFSPWGWYIVAALLFIDSVYVEDAYPPKPDDGELDMSYSPI